MGSRLAHSSLCPLQILALRQARRPVPPEVAQQYQDVVQRSQWQRAQLEQGGAAIRRGRSRNGAGEGCTWKGACLLEVCTVGRELRTPWNGTGTQVGRSSCLALTPSATFQEYATHLERQLHFYTEAARRLGYDGSRVSCVCVVGTEL